MPRTSAPDELVTLLTAHRVKGTGANKVKHYLFPWPRRSTLRYHPRELQAGDIKPCIMGAHVATQRLTYPSGLTFDLCTPCHQKLIP